MKKIVLLFVSFGLSAMIAGCDDIPSGTVDTKPVVVEAKIYSAPDVLLYNSADSSMTTSVKLKTDSEASVSLRVYDPDGDELFSNPVQLLDNGKDGDTTAGDKVYSAKIFFSSKFPNGKYKFAYTVITGNSSNECLLHYMNYYNGQQNYAPIISNLQMPDTVAEFVPFTIKLKVFDANGISDIKNVMLKFYRVEEGTESAEFPLYNDGTHGDEIAGDDIYSWNNQFQEVQNKNRLFSFYAVDRSGIKSNVITKNIYVK